MTTARIPAEITGSTVPSFNYRTLRRRGTQTR